MGITFAAKVAGPTLGLVAVAVAATVSMATADPPAADCAAGYAPRNARAGDNICVSADFARRTAQENRDPSANKEPNGGAYGPATCVQGFVWREAFDGDTICVTPDIRAQNWAANAAPNANRADGPLPTPSGRPQPTPQGGRQVTFVITGSGTVYSIDTDPATARVGENTPVPFSRTVTLEPDVGLLQVVAVSKTGQQGCRILIDGEVVTEQPIGNAHCTYTLP